MCVRFIFVLCVCFFASVRGVRVIQIDVDEDKDGKLQCYGHKSFTFAVNEQFRVYINYTGDIYLPRCYNYDDVPYRMDESSRVKEFHKEVNKPGYTSDGDTFINSNKGTFTYTCQFYKNDICLLPNTCDYVSLSPLKDDAATTCNVVVNAVWRNFGILEPTIETTVDQSSTTEASTSPKASPIEVTFTTIRPTSMVQKMTAPTFNNANGNSKRHKKNPDKDIPEWVLIAGCVSIALIALVFIIIIIIIFLVKRRRRISSAESNDSVRIQSSPETKEGATQMPVQQNQDEPNYAVLYAHSTTDPIPINQKQSDKSQYIRNVEIAGAIPKSRRSEGHYANSGQNSDRLSMIVKCPSGFGTPEKRVTYANNIGNTTDRLNDFDDDYVELTIDDENNENAQEYKSRYDNVFINCGYENADGLDYAVPDHCKDFAKK